MFQNMNAYALCEHWVNICTRVHIYPYAHTHVHTYSHTYVLSCTHTELSEVQRARMEENKKKALQKLQNSQKKKARATCDEVRARVPLCVLVYECVCVFMFFWMYARSWLCICVCVRVLLARDRVSVCRRVCPYVVYGVRCVCILGVAGDRGMTSVQPVSCTPNREPSHLLSHRIVSSIMFDSKLFQSRTRKMRA